MVTDLGFVHRYVPARAEGLPSLLLLHGTGGDENDLLPLGEAMLPGAALLSPRGTVLEQGMSRFFRRLAPGVFDVDDLKARTHELAAFVEAAARTYGLAAPIVAVGYSNGANIAASLLLLHPGLLAGAVLLRPMLPFAPERPVDLGGTSVYVASARDDPLVPAASAEELIALLRDSRASVTVAWRDGGHGLQRRDVTEAAAWLGETFAAHGG